MGKHVMEIWGLILSFMQRMIDHNNKGKKSAILERSLLCFLFWQLYPVDAFVVSLACLCALVRKSPQRLGEHKMLDG